MKHERMSHRPRRFFPLLAAGLGWAALAAALMGAAPAAQAFEDRGTAVYVEAGQAPHSAGNTDVLSAGAMIPWGSRRSLRAGELSFYWDLFASQWHAPAGSLRRDYAQLGAIGTWRLRFDQGRSPWFVEAGVGGSLIDRLYHTPSRDFSTAFQFTEVLGAGYSFGERGQHELSLRLQHFSNAGIKKPNQGENFVRLRYAWRF